MSSEPAQEHEQSNAYLVLRDGVHWRDVYRLVKGHCLTIGRESSNRVVLRDDRCSRRHCEVFHGTDGWVLRDLGSSNGTRVNGEPASEAVVLCDGDAIGIGKVDLLFTDDLSQPLGPDESDIERSTSLDNETTDSLTATVSSRDVNAADADEVAPEILEQKNRSRYHEPGAAGLHRDFARLYQLSAEMVTARDPRALADTVLDGLFRFLTPDIGAILQLPEPVTDSVSARVDDLRILAFRAPDDAPYHRVSDRLSTVALSSGDGMLAMNVSHEPRGSGFQTLESMNAQSVVCAPIRNGETIFGLIHLYSLSSDRALNQDSLDFVLAVAEQLAALLAHLNEQSELAQGLERVEDQNRSLRKMLEIESDLIGESAVMKVLRDEIARFAVSDAAVLIRGESGVGKELVARAIHFNSNRRQSPFICMNCAALTETLLESELFGHEKGSFTGATNRKIGKFEQAHGGTLFLDEVGEMSPQIQAKFLRVLEGHPFERVGGYESVQADVRVVSATNRALEQAVRDGKFRRDLFFRLNVLELDVPPLRDRRDDIHLLIPHFLEIAARRTGREPKLVDETALDLLCRHDWPGNVRELRNAVERASAVAPGQIITASDIRFSNLESEPDDDRSQSGYSPIPLKEVERRHIEATLDFTGWVKRESARILGIERSTLDRKLKSYHIDRPESG